MASMDAEPQIAHCHCMKVFIIEDFQVYFGSGVFDDLQRILCENLLRIFVISIFSLSNYKF